MRPLLSLALALSVGCGADDGKGSGKTTEPCDPCTTTTSSPATIEGLDALNAFLADANVGPCDGDFYGIDLAPLQQAQADALALAADPAATDSAIGDMEATLEGLLSDLPAPIDHRTDLESLLNGVTTISPPGGTPSQLGVVGCNALAVFQSGRWEGVTIGAGRSADGRVLVFSKEIGSALPALADRAADPEMTQLAENTLTWLTARNPVGYDGNRTVKVLVGHGYDSFDPGWPLEHVPFASPLDDPALWDPAVHPIAIVNPRLEDPAEVSVLRDYLDSGGALLMGHQVWTWYADVQASPGQELLAANGLLWRSWYGTGGGPVPPIDDLLMANTDHVLDWLQQVEGDWPSHAALGYDPDEIGAISSYIVDSHGWLPRDWSPLVTPLQARYTALPDDLYPGDLTERPYAMVTVPAVHAVMGLYPDQPAGKGVAVFPGEVAANAIRVDRTLTVDVDLEDPRWLEVPVSPRIRVATGLYAPPAENLTIDVAAVGLDVSGGLGLRIVIGAHTDNLTTNPLLDRPPLVAFGEDLNVGQTVLNSPYGGLIYLDVDRGMLRPGQAEVRIQGAIDAPLFTLGTDDPTSWAATLAASDAPWGDLVAGTMISTLPRYQLDQVADPTPLAQGWADIVSHQYDLMGLHPANAWPHAIPDGTYHFVEDRQISAGWMHSGYPIMAFESANLHTIDEVLSWGPYHELGHNLQQGDWRIEGSGEVSNNLFSLYCAEQFGQGSRLVDQGSYAATDARLAAGDVYADLDVWERLTFYRRLSLAYGWDFYRDLFALTRQLHTDQGYGAAPGQSPEDYLLIRGSEVAGEDLTGVFDAYGIPVSQPARDETAALGLAAPAVPIETLTE